MGRLIVFFTFLASASLADWRFEESTICVLTGETSDSIVVLTHDYAEGRYTISMQRPGQTWQPGPTLSIAFEGGRPLTISTDRHALSEAGDVLSVSDRGFGNVLDGMQFNEQMTILTGEHSVVVPLNQAAPEVQDFRDCPSFKSS